MNCAELWKIIREYPDSAEIVIDVDGARVPLTPEHIQVESGQVLIVVTETQAAAEHDPVKPARKAAKKAK